MMKYLLTLTVLTCGLVAADRPNFVFLLTDDQATITMGCYGNPDALTPHLDQLASEGMIFDRHYDTTAICMASRANILTGMFEYKTGTNFEHGAMLRTHWEKSYPMLLRQAGYRTAFAGKIGIEVTDEPKAKGRLPEEDFDKWGAGPGQTLYATARNKSMAAYAEAYPHSTLSYGAFGRDFIQESKTSGKPFCLSISFKASHMPDTPDPRFDDVYAGKTFTKPENYGREAGKHFSRQSQQGRQYERFESWKYASDYDGVMRRYHQQIYGVDVAVGMIRDALKANGLADNTVVIFTSDNGFLCGSHGYGSKVLPYEESSRVPLIVFDPRHPSSGKKLRCAALTGNVDFAPTMLALAGLPVPENMDGRNLMKLYDDPAAAIHDALPLINVWGPKACHSLGVVTKDTKYVFWNYGADDFEPVEEMYVLSKDPLELQNAALNPEQAPQLEKMRRLYDQALVKWKEEAVPYHNYQSYGTLFDRTIPWSKKGQKPSKPEKPPRPKKRQK
ncbi:MAG: arylsulfatase A-like enzyme [Candidatus Omnitrophota bacterium]|jgi:arylsulfatase A-like enzyme